MDTQKTEPQTRQAWLAKFVIYNPNGSIRNYGLACYVSESDDKAPHDPETNLDNVNALIEEELTERGWQFDSSYVNKRKSKTDSKWQHWQTPYWDVYADSATESRYVGEDYDARKDDSAVIPFELRGINGEGGYNMAIGIKHYQGTESRVLIYNDSAISSAEIEFIYAKALRDGSALAYPEHAQRCGHLPN